MTQPLLSISIVSHKQATLVAQLLGDIQQYCLPHQLEILLTLNVEEELPVGCEHPGYSLKVVRNSRPMGFGSNHNQAFEIALGAFFCVLNPDIRLVMDPFADLLQTLNTHPLGLVAPRIVNSQGGTEQTARHFPTPLGIARKVFNTRREPDYSLQDKLIFPDWVGGMFMLFPRASFAHLGGFDKRYFLYYEDVDLCARSWLEKLQVGLNPKVIVIHDAQRTSHRSLRYLGWHITSMLRFFTSAVYWKVRT